MPTPKKLAIIQSNYIPWRGYFDIIGSVDEFILYDEVQYTRRDWRNRNKIKTPQGLLWLTIPVQVKGKYEQAIRDTVISEPRWAEKHWRAICQNYAKAPFFREYKPQFEELYLGCAETYLSLINHRFLTAICSVLGIRTSIRWSTDYPAKEQGKNERLIELCRKAGASEYLSGPAARDYLDEGLFRRSGIAVSYADYSGYREYPQPHPPFEGAVSILDLIFCTGPQAREYLKSVAPR